MHKMKYAQTFLPTSTALPNESGWPHPKDLNDRELLALIDEMTRTLLGFLEPLDADILSRSDLQGQTVARIAREVGRSESEVATRLRAAQQALCRFVVLTLAPVDSTT